MKTVQKISIIRHFFQDVTKARLPNQDELNMNGTRTALCRVLLSNGSTTVVQIKESETIQQLVTRLLDKRGITYSSFEVFTNKQPKVSLTHTD